MTYLPLRDPLPLTVVRPILKHEFGKQNYVIDSITLGLMTMRNP